MLYWSNSKKVHTLPIDVYSGGPIPHNMAQTFDGPPTLERSGSEHRRAVTSFLLRRKAWLEVELPLAKGRRRDSKDSFFNGKEGRDDFRKKNIKTQYHYE